MRAAPVRISHIVLFILGSLILLTLGSLILEEFASLSVGSVEFPVNYHAAKNWVIQGRNPYDPLNADQVIDQFLPYEDGKTDGPLTYFRYPILTTLLIMPFTLLPLASAKAAWMVFSILCLVTGSVLMVAVSGKKANNWILVGLAILSVTNVFSMAVLAAGSLLPQLFLVIMLILVFLKGRRDSIAGFISTGALIIPQFGLLTLIFLNVWAINTKRKAYLTSFWAGLIFMLGVSTIIEPVWLKGWLVSILRDINLDGSYPSLLARLIGVYYGDVLLINLVAHLSLLLLLIASTSSFIFKDVDGLAWMLSIVLTISSLVAFPAFPGIQLLCIPAIIMVARTWTTRGEATRRTFFWVFLALLIIPTWVMGFLTDQKAQTLINGLLYAIIALAGLYWIRWWMIRPKY